MTRDQGQDPSTKKFSSELEPRAEGYPDQVDMFARNKLNIWFERWTPRFGVFVGVFMLTNGIFGDRENGLLMAASGGAVLLWSSYCSRYIRPYEEIQIDQQAITFLPHGHSLPLHDIRELTGPSWLDRDDTHQAREITLTMASARREWFFGIYRWAGHTCKVSVGGTDARGILLTISNRIGKAPFFV